MWLPVSCKTLNVSPMVFCLEVKELVTSARRYCDIPRTFVFMFCVFCDNSCLCIWSSRITI
jgi:hypothetical protein